MCRVKCEGLAWGFLEPSVTDDNPTDARFYKYFGIAKFSSEGDNDQRGECSPGVGSELTHQSQKLIFLPSCQVDKIPILHFDLPAVSPDIALDILEIDNMRMVGSEKDILG